MLFRGGQSTNSYDIQNIITSGSCYVLYVFLSYGHLKLGEAMAGNQASCGMRLLKGQSHQEAWL